jgi:hypothetical protein
MCPCWNKIPPVLSDVVCHELPPRSDGPDSSLIQRLRLFHDFAYREFERLETFFLWLSNQQRDDLSTCVLHIQRPVTFLDERPRFLHIFGDLDDSCSYPPCNFTRSNDYWSFIINPDLTAQILSRFLISRVGRLESFLPLTFQSAKRWYFATCPS